MENTHFDRLVRTLATTGVRRRSLAALIAGLLLPGLAEDEGSARKRRNEKRREGRNGRHGQHRAEALQSEKKKKKKKKNKKSSPPVTPPVPPPPPPGCVAEAKVTTCANTCGSVVNNCGTVVDCGAGACSNPMPVCAAGQCVACSASALCASGQVCCSGSCFTGDCCGAGDCLDPNKPICVQNTCSACTSTNQCPSGSICGGGACLECDVCAEGCTYDAIQAAIDAANFTDDPITVVVCPGTYLNANGRFEIRDRHPAVTLIGAGDGSDPASNTVLQNTETPQTVVYVDASCALNLQGVRVTGGQGNQQGGGIYNNSSATLNVTDCTITDNAATFFGGGIMNFGSLTFAGSNSVIGNSVDPGDQGSGIYIGDGGSLTGREFVTVSDNTPENDQCYGCPA